MYASWSGTASSRPNLTSVANALVVGSRIWPAPAGFDGVKRILLHSSCRAAGFRSSIVYRAAPSIQPAAIEQRTTHSSPSHRQCSRPVSERALRQLTRIPMWSEQLRRAYAGAFEVRFLCAAAMRLRAATLIVRLLGAVPSVAAFGLRWPSWV